MIKFEHQNYFGVHICVFIFPFTRLTPFIAQASIELILMI